MAAANMKRHLFIYALVWSIAFARSAINDQQNSKLSFSSIPTIEDAIKDSAEDITKSKDLDVSASDRRKGYNGYGPSGYGVGSGLPTTSGVEALYGVYPGIGTGSTYGSSITYPDTRLGTGYRSYQNPLRTGIIGGGHTGYGYYGSTGAAGFDDVGVYGGGASTYELPGSHGGGYDDFSLSYNRRPGGYGGHKFIPSYGSYGGSGTYAGYGENNGYATNDYGSYQGHGTDGSYGNNYGTGSGYDPYAYRTGTYGRGYSTSRGYNVYPSGYRGYS